MKIEEIIADFSARGQISPEAANCLLTVYRHELSRTGNMADARHKLLEMLSETPEQRQQKMAVARATILSAVMQRIAPRPVPVGARLLQSIVGAILGAALAALSAFLLFYSLLFLVELAFGSTPSRIRIPVKGLLALVIAPAAGAVMGAIYGWRFDFREARAALRRYLDASSVYERAWMAWGIVWTVIILIGFAAFDPFDRYRLSNWQQADWLSFIFLWAGPIVGGWGATKLVTWVAAGRR